MVRPCYQIGIIGAGSALTAACARALRGQADLTPLIPSVHLPEMASLDLLLLVMVEPFEKSVRFFAQCRESVPQLPVILLADGLAANDAVELIKCGVTDLLLMPMDERALWRKVERALLGVVRPAFDKPFLTVLFLPEAPVDQNRRHCCRVALPPDFPANLHTRGAREEAVLTVENLSLPSERRPGGMALRADTTKIPSDLLVSWVAGRDFDGSVELGSNADRIPLRARIVRLSKRSYGSSGFIVSMGIEYLLSDPRHEERVQRFWVEAQRRRIAARGSSRTA